MKSVKKNFIYNATLQVLLMIVPFITTPYLTRIIGADGIGTYAYYYSIVSYFSMFVQLGIANYGNRAIAEKQGDKQKLNEVFSELIYLKLCIGIIVLVLYIAYCFFFSSDKNYTLLFVTIIISACIDINWVLAGMEEFKAIAIRNVTIKVISTILIFLLVNESKDVPCYCIILNISNLVSCAIAWPIVLKKLKLVKVPYKNILVHIKPNLILFASVVSISIYKSMDKIMLGFMIPGKTEVGYYEAAERIVHIPYVLVTALGTVMMPRMTHLFSANSKEVAKKVIFAGIVFSMMIASSISFGIMGVAREFVPFYYGAGFERVVFLYYILLPCCLFMAFSNVLSTQFVLPNHGDKIVLMSCVFAAIVNLIINWVFIPYFGAVGTAYGTLVAEAVSCIWQAYSIRKSLDLRKYIKYSINIGLMGGLMFVALFMMDFSFISNVILQILIKVVIGGILFLTEVFFFYLHIKKSDDEDVQYMLESLSQSLNKIKNKIRRSI